MSPSSGTRRRQRDHGKKGKGGKGKVTHEIETEKDMEDRGQMVLLTCPICLRYESQDQVKMREHLGQEHSREEVAEELARLLDEIARGEEGQEDDWNAENYLGDEEVEEEISDEAEEQGESLAEVRSEKFLPPSNDAKVEKALDKLGTRKKKIKKEDAGNARAELVCPVCNKSFSSKGNLTKHAISHSDKKPFSCKECGQAFNQNRDLKTHQMQQHTGERPHVCDLCGKGFVHKSYLTEHMDYHTGRRRFQCHKCGKKFSSSSILAKHVARHSSKKDFACPTCNKCFVIKADMATHIRLVHNKYGRQDRPVFPAKSDKKRKRPLIPPNYSLIKQEEGEDLAAPQDTITTADGKVVPYYEKPKPVLRMTGNPSMSQQDLLHTYPSTPSSMVTRSMSASSAATEAFQVDQSAPLPSFKQLKASSSSLAENLTPEEESQRQIEEWMISEGVNLGPEQHPVVDANALQMQQQHAIQPHPLPQHHVALKIPNVTHLSMADFPSPSDNLQAVPNPSISLPQFPVSSSSLTIPPFITLRTLLPLKLQQPIPLAELALPTTPVTPSPLTPNLPTQPNLGGAEK